MNDDRHNIPALWRKLAEVQDPEIPVLNVVEMGIVREVRCEGKKECEVLITPTYTGCPAMKVIEDDIVKKLEGEGFEKVKVTTVLSPPWTTDWLSGEARRKLSEFGIAPPSQRSADSPEKCPHCEGKNITLKSPFGSTPCKALWVCSDCKEPFDYFKCH